VLQRRPHGGEIARLGEDLEDVVVHGDVEAPGLDGGQQVVLGVARRVDHDHAALVEQVGDRAGLAQVAARPW
jgi:hypothetical protein